MNSKQLQVANQKFTLHQLFLYEINVSCISLSCIRWVKCLQHQTCCKHFTHRIHDKDIHDTLISYTSIIQVIHACEQLKCIPQI